MKTLFPRTIMAAAIAAAGLAGCVPGDRFLRVNPSALEITAEDTHTHPVTVEASASWIVDVSGTVEWLDVSYDENDPNLLWVKAGANENLVERSDTIIIVSGDGQILGIPLVQLAMNVRLDATPRVLEPFGAQDRSTRTITVETNLASDWEFEQLSGDWLTIEQGGEGAENILTVSAQPTRLLDERRDTIVIRPVREAYYERSDSIAVVQAGIDLLVDSDMMNQTTFDIEVPAEGGEVPLLVSSRNAWRVRTEASPGRVSLDLTEGAADMENGIPIVVTVAPNVDTEEYIFTLAFESAGETYEYKFVQAAAGPEQEEPEPEPETT